MSAFYMYIYLGLKIFKNEEGIRLIDFSDTLDGNIQNIVHYLMNLKKYRS